MNTADESPARGLDKDRFYKIAVFNLISAVVCAVIYYVTFFEMAAARSSSSFIYGINGTGSYPTLPSTYGNWVMLALSVAMIVVGLLLSPKRQALLRINYSFCVLSMILTTSLVTRVFKFSHTFGLPAAVIFGGAAIAPLNILRIVLYFFQIFLTGLLIRKVKDGRNCHD